MESFERTKSSKLVNVVAILSGVIGIVVLLFKDVLQNYNLLNSRIILIIAVVLILNFIAVFLLNYLRTGHIFSLSTNSNEDLMRDELSVLRKELKNSAKMIKNNERVYFEVNNLKKIISETNFKDEIFTENEKDTILKELKKEILENISDSLLVEIEKKYSVEIRKDKYLSDLRQQCEQVRQRMTREIEALGRRGNLNLVIGVITTIAAVTLLSTTLLSGNIQLTSNELTTYYIPRLTLSIFIEIFSFFFLRLYKTGLGEIKYFQNELTNVEMKFIAVEKAVVSDKDDSITNVINELIATERNFKLSKGESTVDLEKYQSDQASNQKIIESIVGLISKK